MKYLLLIVAFLINSAVFAQVGAFNVNDWMPAIVIPTNPCTLYDSYDMESAKTVAGVPKGETILVASYYKGPPGMYHVCYMGFVGYLYMSNKYFFEYESEKLREIEANEMADDSLRIMKTVSLSLKLNARKIEEARLDSLKRVKYKATTKQVGIGVNLFKCSYPNEYSSFATIDIGVTNYSKKVIRYVHFTVAAYDAVDGRISSLGKSSVKLKGIGPIEPNDYGTYEFEDAIYSKVISYAKLLRIDIEYMDGTTKAITEVKSIMPIN